MVSSDSTSGSSTKYLGGGYSKDIEELQVRNGNFDVLVPERIDRNRNIVLQCLGKWIL